jgi:Bacterial TniB protein
MSAVVDAQFGTSAAADHPDRQDRELLPKTRALLQAPNAERIAVIQRDRYIPTTFTIKALNQLKEHFRWERVIRQPGVIFYADADCGKTTVIAEFAQSHSFQERRDSPSDLNELIVIEPDSASEHEFVDCLLAETRTSIKLSRLADKKRHLYAVLGKQHTRMIIIDEFPAILAGSVKQRLKIWKIIRKIANRNITIVLVGTETVITSLLRDGHIATRFPFEITLPLWKDGDQWIEFLYSFEATLPLRKRSDLWANATIRKYVLDRAKGALGAAILLLQVAAMEAITNGEEMITLDLLKKVKVEGNR